MSFSKDFKTEIIGRCTDALCGYTIVEHHNTYNEIVLKVETDKGPRFFVLSIKELL
jgi:hypothetical protein